MVLPRTPALAGVQPVFVNSAFDNGEIRVPFIFGVGVFGTSVRWKGRGGVPRANQGWRPDSVGPVAGEGSPAGI